LRIRTPEVDAAISARVETEVRRDVLGNTFFEAPRRAPVEIEERDEWGREDRLCT